MRTLTIVSAVLFAAFGVSAPAKAQVLSAQEGKQLNGTEITRAFSGNKITGLNQYGNDYIITLAPGGKMTGQAIDPDGVLVAEDTGTWSVRRNQYCREWQNWADGISACYHVVQDGDRMKFFNQNRLLAFISTIEPSN